MSSRANGMRLLAVAALVALPLLPACRSGGGVVVASGPAYSVREAAVGHEVVGIPRGHMPPPGLCRVWFPGRPPGHQPPPGPCAKLAHSVPPHAWLLRRPTTARRVFRIR